MADKTVLEVDNIETLYLTPSLERQASGRGQLAGYKREIVSQQLSNIELQLLVCYFCSGFMRNACNTQAGAAMGCEICVGSGQWAQAVGTVRTMVSNLKCVCPLQSRGCFWEGSLGDVALHLDGCDCLVVACGYSVYGCAQRLRRGDLPSHRGESNEYHTELMSAFMTQKIEQLESANSVQGEAIVDLQQSVTRLMAEREYLRPNGVLWRFTQRDNIIQMVQEFEQKRPINPRAGGNTLSGPIFEIDSLQLRPQLVIESADKVSLELVSVATGAIQQQPNQPNYNSIYGQFNLYGMPLGGYGTQGTTVANEKCKWPLGGKCKVILVNPTNRKADWLGEINTSQFTDNQPIKLTNIPSKVLLSDDYNNNGTIEIQLLFKTPYN